jgi:NodT family efflux transporter outer membrane factor (OMF) lipoprotein
VSARSAACRSGAALVVLLAGCTVGPDYVKPTVETPETYKEAALDQTQWNPSNPQAHLPRGKWWEVYNDPTLNALESQVDAANQSIASAEAAYRQARALVQFNRAGYFPTVTAGAGVSRQRGSENVPNANVGNIGPNNNFLLSADVSWEIDLWGRIRRAVEASEANAQAFAADLETVRLSIQAELAFDYFLLRGVDAQRQLLDKTIEAYGTALDLTRNRFQGGVSPELDVAQAETQLRTTEAQAIDLGVQRALLEHAIALLIGKPPAAFSLPIAPLDAPPPDIPLEQPSHLLERRPDVASAERQVAAANARIGVAKAAYYPTVTLSGSVGFEASDIGHWLSWPSRFWSVGPAISQVVYDGGVRRALNDQAQAAYDQTVANYRQTVLTAFQDVEDNLASLRILAAEATVQASAVKAADHSLELTINRYEAGASNYLDVVVIQAVALNNQRTAVDISTRRIAASVRLVKALGGDWSVAQLPSASEVAERTGKDTAR